MKFMLVLIGLLVSVFISNLASAASYVDCPGVQKGEEGGDDDPAWYSDCSMRKTESGSEAHFVMYLDRDASQVRVTFRGKESLTPSPTSDLPQGVWSTYGVEKMPESYTGTCEEVTATDENAASSEGIYCGVANSESGERLLIKATVNKSELNDGSVQRRDDSGGAIATRSRYACCGSLCVDPVSAWLGFEVIASSGLTAPLSAASVRIFAGVLRKSDALQS